VSLQALRRIDKPNPRRHEICIPTAFELQIGCSAP
jgi:hypothetical protein